MAMIGFTAAIANEAITGASLWQQLYFAPYAYLSAYLLVVAAAQLNRAFGSPTQGNFCLCWGVTKLLWLCLHVIVACELAAWVCKHLKIGHWNACHPNMAAATVGLRCLHT